MADNTELPSGSGGDTIRTEQHGGSGPKTPVSLIDVGGTGASESIIGDSGVYMPVAGAAAENAAAAGNPILVGGRYDSSARTLGNADVGAIALAADGAVHIDDGGNTITIDGTVTANLSATDNAVLDVIATTAYVDDADWTATTSSHTLVGGVYQSTPGTITDGDTGPLRVNANGAIHVSIEADNAGIGGGTQYTEDAAAAANPVGTMPVFVRADTPATIASADGDVVAARGTDYGAMYVQLVTSSGSFIDSVGGGTQYAVDAALGSTPTGTLAVAIRDDALSSLTPAEGDAIGLRVDANGALWVIPSGTTTVDNGGTFAVQVNGDALTALQKIDDPVLVDDAAFTPTTSSVMMAGFQFDDTTPDSVDEGDAGAARMSARRELYVQIRDAAGNERGLNIDANGDIGVTTALDGAIAGSEIQVDVVGALPAGTNAIGKLAANSGVDIGDVDVLSVVAGTGATSLGKAEDAAHSSADTGVAMLAVRRDTAAVGSDTDGDYSTFNVDASGRLWTHDPVAVALLTTIDSDTSTLATTGGGTESGALRVTVASDSTGVLSVDDNGSSLTVDNGGTFATQVTTSATGGASMHFDADGDNSVQQVKASAGTILGIEVSNPNSADAYLQLFDVASGSITVGTTTPNLSLFVPAGDGTKDGAMDKSWGPSGVAFATEINYACTTTATGNTDPTTGLVVNVIYK